MIPRTLTVVSATLLVATIVIGAELSFKANNAIAQTMGNMISDMMMGPGMMGPGMMGPGMMASNQSVMTQMMKPGQNITSSVNLMEIIPQAIGSRVNVSLSNATTTAEDSIGNNSHAVASHINEHNGYLVYNVMVIDPSMNISKVIVDPGNGDVLLTEQISKEEHMMMHKMGGQHTMMGPGMMGPGMMGPGMMMGGGHNMMMGAQHGGGMMMGPMNQGLMGGYPG
jgi:hypothetical protein